MEKEDIENIYNEFWKYTLIDRLDLEEKTKSGNKDAIVKWLMFGIWRKLKNNGLKMPDEQRKNMFIKIFEVVKIGVENA